MSGLLVPVGFPAVQAPGTEGLGKNVDTTTLTIVSPNGIVAPPARAKSGAKFAINARSSLDRRSDAVVSIATRVSITSA